MKIINIISQKDLKIFIIGTVVAGVVQYSCWRYVKNNPEKFQNLDDLDDELSKEIAHEIANGTSKKDKRYKRILRILSTRGGSVTEKLSLLIFKFLMKRAIRRIIKHLSKRALSDAILTVGVGVIMKQFFPAKALTKCLRILYPFTQDALVDGSPINHTKWKYLESTKIDPLESCEYSWHYIIQVLLNKELPYSEREQKVRFVLKRYLSFETKTDMVQFIFCIVAVMVFFAAVDDKTSLFIMMQNLLEALKKGKISKKVARIIIRKLLRQNVVVDPELIAAAAGY